MIGQGLTIQQIAVRLHLSPKTIETHREKIKQKLNLKSSTELNRRAVQWVLERGWLTTPAENVRRRRPRLYSDPTSLVEVVKQVFG